MPYMKALNTYTLTITNWFPLNIQAILNQKEQCVLELDNKYRSDDFNKNLTQHSRPNILQINW